MVVRGNNDAGGYGEGVISVTATADVTAFNANAAWLATIPLGQMLVDDQAGTAYVLRNNAGTRSFVSI